MATTLQQIPVHFVATPSSVALDDDKLLEYFLRALSDGFLFPCFSSIFTHFYPDFTIKWMTSGWILVNIGEYW